MWPDPKAASLPCPWRDGDAVIRSLLTQSPCKADGQTPPLRTGLFTRRQSLGPSPGVVKTTPRPVLLFPEACSHPRASTLRLPHQPRPLRVSRPVCSINSSTFRSQAQPANLLLFRISLLRLVWLPGSRARLVRSSSQHASSEFRQACGVKFPIQGSNPGFPN